MSSGMFLGLGSAVGFGVADVSGAVSAKKLGVPVTVFIIQSFNVVMLSLLLLTPIPGALSAGRGAVVAIAASGLLGTLSFFSFYRALQLGPVSVVSPVFASYAALTVVLSVALNGEHLSGLAALGVSSTIAGVVLASSRSSRDRGDDASRAGIPFALVATLSWGVASYLIGRYSQQVGWYLPLFGSRLVEFACMATILIVLRARGATVVFPRGRFALIPAVSGLADNIAVGAFARGSQLGFISITSAVSATFPLVVIAGGVILFHERPTKRQWTGVVLTIAGLVVLGLSR